MAEMNGPRFKFSFGKQVNNVKCASDSVLYCLAAVIGVDEL